MATPIQSRKIEPGTTRSGIAREFMDETRLLFGMMDFPYTGANGAWEVGQQEVTNGTYTETMAGFITLGGRFRPFTPGLLAEGMARRIDQWLKRNMAYNGHTWAANVYETDIYNGIRNHPKRTNTSSQFSHLPYLRIGVRHRPPRLPGQWL